MRKKMWRILVGILVAAIVIAAVMLLNQGAQDFHHKYEGTDLTTDVTGIGREDTYEAYLQAHAAVSQGTEAIQVDIAAFEGDGKLQQDASGAAEVYTADNDYTTWTVNVPQEGMYAVQMEYLTVESRGVDVEREVYINDVLPFAGADTLRFSRLWIDAGEVRQDNQGNDIRPSQMEKYEYQTAFFRDDMGYETEPYQFYFAQGENKLSLKAVNEPVIVRSLALVPVTGYQSYEDYLAAQPQVTMSDEAQKWQLTIEGEDAETRSSPSLYARYDHASPSTVPYDVYHTVLNYIGGDPWNTSGQWIEWDFEVPEDGYYNISVKARQTYQRGGLSCRTVYLDGQVPFEDMSSVSFAYDTEWQLRTLADEAGNPYRFYLNAGKHTIRLEVTLGEMGGILKSMEDSIYRLNQIYRKVLVLTGVSPDRFRDYNIPKVYPEVMEAMDLESKRLYKLVDDTVQLTGQKNDRVATAQTLAVQLEQFVDRHERITQSFSNFKDNITSLGTAMQNMAESKLDVDQIIITGEKAQPDVKRANFFTSIVHEVRACVASFFVDYNSLGDVYDENAEDVIEVWLVTGRDQSTVLKTMIDDTFTSQSGIKVNVQLVAPDAILNAVMAGIGPDVVLSVDGWFAVNYAMRNAVEDLTQFEDFEEVTKSFYQSALDPLTYDNGTHKGVFGLPETQLFSVLFYREDVLADLGLEVPQTWDDLIAMLPTIQGNNMSVGVPFPDISNVDMSGFNALIYQNGGAIYNDSKTRTVIDSEAGVAAFELYTSLYNDYGLPTVFDFVSRFRSGEMPIGVGQYSLYNTLAVSAPEIRGLWDFALYPGTLQADGTIDRSCHANGLCCMMIATDDETVKKNAWEFMKWWVSADSQVRFGREMESVLGSSARYATANTEALDQLAWSTEQLTVLKEQQKWGVGFPEIAGGYSTTRHMTNAIRKVINDKDDPRETLLTYTRTINEEIDIKRKEFNLPLYADLYGEEETK
ncbi:MAG: extracellular solute-binding protein [Clostridia bacterium]|nr:extracellular solute-binding protein [Clostridia bacterium]MBQ8620599.1 extracellular solute-binding protein [Clostridia bacterium]